MPGLFRAETVLLLFRVALLAGLFIAVWRWGDWRRWQRYYPTMLFVMAVNLAAAFITYHHPLWDFNPDTLALSETTVELLNTFVSLPANTLIYLSNYPAAGPVRQIRYILAWVLLFGALEAADTLIGGITYFNGWSLGHSILFDCAMFPIIRLHHLRPPLAWLASLAVAVYILSAFGFSGAEMK
ncbi:CBO0543 family protein [Anaeroselena agilis]|uniref:CBO0543 family protein n=1 Tax=Anaeroselena agilis TaxID=3063788 RepID=A0ABU3P040_9FIRM|nr:CBO0543 family protein [Selenomonadales bacterium 4137-cl]